MVSVQPATNSASTENLDSEPLPAVGHADEHQISGALKLFDVTRGFGFIVADEPGYGDVLVHFSVLQAHGRRSLPEGARIDCLAVQRDRGFQATEILSIDLTNAVEPMPRLRTSDERIDPSALIEQAGAF